MSTRPHIIIAGGGTGGHVFPAIAIGQEIRDHFPNATIQFVGALGKLEMAKVPAAGFSITGLWISGFSRGKIYKNIALPIKLISSILKSVSIVNRIKPDVCIGVGGYASGPLCYVAAKRGIPVVLLEQNSYPGVTNKLLAKVASHICTAFPNMDRFFGSTPITQTGNPIRQTILECSYSKEGARAQLGIDPNKKTIFLTGGSLGAGTLNAAMANSLQQLRESEIQIIWQCGKGYIEQYENSEVAQLENVHISAFVEDMGIAYQAADLVIARAGALTISELCALNKASILVPSPNVAEDHQTENAKALVESGAAIYVKDSDAEMKLVPVALETIGNDEKLNQLSKSIQQFARPDATQQILDVIQSHLK